MKGLKQEFFLSLPYKVQQNLHPRSSEKEKCTYMGIDIDNQCLDILFFAYIKLSLLRERHQIYFQETRSITYSVGHENSTQKSSICVQGNQTRQIQDIRIEGKLGVLIFRQ